MLRAVRFGKLSTCVSSRFQDTARFWSVSAGAQSSPQSHTGSISSSSLIATGSGWSSDFTVAQDGDDANSPPTSSSEALSMVRDWAKSTSILGVKSMTGVLQWLSLGMGLLQTSWVLVTVALMHWRCWTSVLDVDSGFPLFSSVFIFFSLSLCVSVVL